MRRLHTPPTLPTQPGRRLNPSGRSAPRDAAAGAAGRSGDGWERLGRAGSGWDGWEAGTERGPPVQAGEEGQSQQDKEGQAAPAAPAPTEEAAAEAVPDAAGGVPHPAAPQAGHEGKAHAEDGHQQVAEADVDEEEVGGRAEPLELVVEHQHQQVVAQAQHADGGDQQRQQLVGTGAEEGPLARHLLLGRRGLRAAGGARAILGGHGSRPERG